MGPLRHRRITSSASPLFLRPEASGPGPAWWSTAGSPAPTVPFLPSAPRLWTMSSPAPRVYDDRDLRARASRWSGWRAYERLWALSSQPVRQRGWPYSPRENGGAARRLRARCPGPGIGGRGERPHPGPGQLLQLRGWESVPFRRRPYVGRRGSASSPGPKSSRPAGPPRPSSSVGPGFPQKPIAAGGVVRGDVSPRAGTGRVSLTRSGDTSRQDSSHLEVAAGDLAQFVAGCPLSQ